MRQTKKQSAFQDQIIAAKKGNVETLRSETYLKRKPRNVETWECLNWAPLTPLPPQKKNCSRVLLQKPPLKRRS